MKAKRIAIKTQEKIKHYREKKREEAFKVLEDAEKLTKTGNFDQAIGSYRQAALILSEIQYPLDSIHEMIKKVQIKKVEQDQLKQQELESQLLKQKEEAALQEIIEERKRQETELKKKKLAATKEREELIAKTESRREAAFSILEKADNFLKKFPPDFDNAIELYLEAKKILLEINWEPEIKNLDDLISNLRQEKQKFAIQQKQEEEAQLRAAEEYKRYQQEILREKLEVQRTKEEQLKKFREFKLEQETREKYQHEGLAYLDVAKKSVSMHQYNIAYEQFEQAIEKFEAIGWIEQIKYIKNEIENTKKAEANFIKAQEQVRLAHEALLKQKELKEQRKKEEEEEQRKSIKTISVLSDDLVESLKQQRIEREEAEEAKIKKLKKESTSFGKEMGKLIQLKHELMEELEKAEEEEKKKQVAEEKKKGKKELDDISKMIREASKKE
jgi:hypothetical protein